MVLGSRADAGPAPGPARGSAQDGADDGAPAPGRGPLLPLALALGATAVVGFLAVPVGEVLERAAAALGVS